MEIVDLNTSQDMQLSKIFAESGIFPDIKSAAQGYIKIIAGKELGLTPMQSLNSFYFVSGKLGITSNTVAALLKKSNKYIYTIDVLTNEECVISFFKIIENSDPIKLGESVFTIKDAARAGIVNKENWKNYPKNMLFARALMNGARWFCPDAISGFTYAYEELIDLPAQQKNITINEQGEVKEGENGETKVQ